MSKKLGTLTLDLIAKIGKFVKPMKDAEKQSVKTFDEIKRGAEIVKKSMPTMATATVAALGAMTASHVNAANEAAKLALIADTNAVAFQQYAAGAQAVGVESEKFADIIKDVNEKMGEFAATGGGGAKDFFDEIAPKVGVTIEQFQKLSGPEALQLYKDSLDKAKVPQKDQIFYLESLASDSKLLIPLLAQSGKGFDAYAESVAASGAVMSEEAIAKAQTLKTVQGQLGNELTGLKNQIAQAVVPTLIELGTSILGAADEGRGFVNIGGMVHAMVSTIARVVTGAATSFKLLGKGIAVVLGGIYEFTTKGYGAAKAYIATGVDDIADTMAEAAAQQERLKNATGETTSKIKDMVDVTRQHSQHAQATGEAAYTAAQRAKAAAEAAKKASKEQAQAAKSVNTELQKQARLAEKAAQAIQRTRDVRLSDFQNIADNFKPPEDRADEAYALRNARIREFGGSNAKKMLEQSYRIYAQERAEIEVYNRQALAKFDSIYKTRQKIIRDHYDDEQFLIEHNSKLSKEDKQKAMQANVILRETELRKIELDDARRLSSLTSFNKSAIELIRERYQYERDQLAINYKLDDKSRAKLLDAYNEKETHEIAELKRRQGKAFERQGHIINGTNDSYQIDMEKQNRIDQLNEWRNNDIISAEEHAARLLDIDRDYYAKKAALQSTKMGAYASTFASIFKLIGGEQSKAFRVMFAAQKAFDFVSAQSSSFAAIAKAWASAPFPANIPAVVTTTIETGVIPAAINALVPKGFKSGGYTGNMGVSDVAGIVHGREFVAHADATRKYRPQLEAMNKGTYSEGAQVTVEVHNHAGVDVQTEDMGDGKLRLTIRKEAQNLVTQQLGQANSPIMKALHNNTTAQRVRR